MKFDWQDKVKVSAGLATILDKMVAHREADRYETAEQVLQDLTNLSPGGAQNWTAAPQTDWTTAPKPKPLQTEGSLKTLVVAPLGTETVMATGTAPPKSPPPFGAAVGAAKGMPGVVWKGATGLMRSLLIVLLLVGAGALGWMGVRGWIQYQFSNSLVNNKPTPQQTKGYSSNEKQRKAQLINRLERSGVSSSFFYRVTNEAYYLQYPDQRGHLLSNGPEDASLRSNWDRVGTQVLDLSEQLSSSTRARLGRYTARDRIQQVQQLRAAQVDVRQFEQDATSRLTDALPMYKDVDLRNTLAFQLLNGLAADRIQRVNAGGSP